ncbi:MAG: GIY-YIG nuclease family protein [Chloroflexota bacterium]|nr:GIY-YIG nuclease family protein [Chloroflexota bacterium]MDE2885080.1 GIY-YIG nuclease family protein [Chloroflexota bacterium]
MVQQNNQSGTESQTQPGAVYVLSNERMPGVVKIGRVKGIALTDVRSRIRGFQAGSPSPYNIEYVARVDDGVWTERTLHLIHDANRIREPGGGSEWFRISVKSAIATFELAGLKLLEEAGESLELDDELAVLAAWKRSRLRGAARAA